MAKAGDPPPQVRSAQHLQPGHCFGQVRSEGFALFPLKIPPALGKADAAKLNPSSIHECAPSCQHRMGYSFQTLTVRSKHACCSPPSDRLASPAAAPRSHREPPSLLRGRPTPSSAGGGWQGGSLGLVRSPARLQDVALGWKAKHRSRALLIKGCIGCLIPAGERQHPAALSHAQQAVELEGFSGDLAHPGLFAQRLQDIGDSKRQPMK